MTAIAVVLLIGGVALELVTLGARAGSSEPVLDDSAGRNVVDIPPYDFDASPLGDAPGSKVSLGSDQLATTLSVPAIIPKSAEATPAVFVTDPEVPNDWRMIVLDYPDSAYGRVQIFERAQGMTQENIDQWTEPGYCTTCTLAESVVLAGGQRAAVLGTPETTIAVHWIQKGIQIDVVGPYGSLNLDQAVSLANDLAAQ